MGQSNFSRRNFLKLLGAVPVTYGLGKLVKALPTSAGQQNHIIILVFDAWSAHNVSFLGYKRDTMPNLAKFANSATVYHSHHSGGNYTVPGTASLLTGTYPFTHRALVLGAPISQAYAHKTMFNYLGNKMDTVGFAQNVYADQFLFGAGEGLHRHIPFGTFNLTDEVVYDASIFANDQFTAFSAFEDGIFHHKKYKDSSLVLGPLNRVRISHDKFAAKQANQEGYYNGIPESIESYTLAALVDGMISTIESLQQPSLLYFHVFTPHEPYRPKSRFYNAFKDDGIHVPELPTHPLVRYPKTQKELDDDVLDYDAYIASWDDELGKFFTYLNTSGVKENSHIIITADHGEMFERGESGHTTRLLFEPVVHIPLLISSPGQTERKDIHVPTTAIDVLPTVSTWSGLDKPDWAQGQVLAGQGGEEDPARSIFIFDSQSDAVFGVYKHYSLALIKNGFKMVRYKYQKYLQTELYDLTNDPEETKDLYAQQPAGAAGMEAELVAKLKEIGAELELSAKE